MTTRVLVVDDHELLAAGVVSSLRAQGHDAEAARVRSFPSLAELRDQVVAQRPHVLVLDLQLGDLGHGSALVAPAVAAGCRVLVVSGVTDVHELAATVEAGAVGFVNKREPVEVLLEAVATVVRGEPLLSDNARQELLAELRRHRAEVAEAARPFERLTTREREVLEALYEGRAVTAIAQQFVVSVATVRSQVRGILQKLDVGSQLEAVALAHRQGWFARTVVGA